eukprot:jgi/Mesvir1/17532/Mv08785-RA.1
MASLSTSIPVTTCRLLAATSSRLRPIQSSRHGEQRSRLIPNNADLRWKGLALQGLGQPLALRIAGPSLRTPLSNKARTVTASSEASDVPKPLAGEDAAVFELEQQSLKSWAYFFGVLGTVMAALYVIWLEPSIDLGGKLVDNLEAIAGSPEATILLILFVFAVAHSGLAGLRPVGEQIIGARGYRVLFGVVSLPLAVTAVVYFINHRYSGTQLWNIQSVPGVHTAVWLASFISFFFLYPSTFNLLEVAAVDKPKLHLWETGVMRITRHPQMVGQFVWCLAHTAWIGSSFMMATTAGLMLHHLFGVWHGDRRLEAKYGDAFREVKARTSILPFQAIIEGRQVLPPDYLKEWARVPYFGILIFTLGAYFSHPLMQAGSYYLGW